MPMSNKIISGNGRNPSIESINSRPFSASITTWKFWKDLISEQIATRIKA